MLSTLLNKLLTMRVTKINVVEENGDLTPCIYLHDDAGVNHLFIDKDFHLKLHVKEFYFVSGTPILKL